MKNLQKLPVQTASINNRHNFWKAIKLSVVKPHTINRQLAGSEQISLFKCDCSAHTSTRDDFIKQIVAYIREQNDLPTNGNLMPEICYALGIKWGLEEVKTQYLLELDANSDKSNNLLIVLNKLLPKNLKYHQNSFELIIFDFEHNRAIFLSLNSRTALNNAKSFVIELKNKESSSYNLVSSLLIDADELDENISKQRNWLEKVYFPKILKWIESMDDDEDSQTNKGIGSISLINLTEYNVLYNQLKAKYGENMVKTWPEQTDPSKFVYEDVAIATYLLLMWQDERKQNNTDQLQSFVDLGCGNGLLVYILSSEGHRGYGIDVRKRGIWDSFPSTTVLKEEAIVPSDRQLFHDIDWIIGNHSDELSPWVPVISARSSYKSRYFLLPCCAFEFSGKKYQRRHCQKSQYMDFLDYVRQVSDVCGFHTKIDRLKIPSTKRICLIGNGRVYTANEQPTRNIQIQEFINQESNSTFTSASGAASAWNSEFQPRSNVEKVQNCTKIDKAIEKEIVKIVFCALMAKKRYLHDFCRPDWNVGGKISLADVIKIVPRDKLKELKSECGGLQTLLRNNSQIFRVVGGAVEVRIPINISDKIRQLEQNSIDKSKCGKIHIKQKPCWFLANHPNGCPYDDNDCSFKH